MLDISIKLVENFKLVLKNILKLLKNYDIQIIPKIINVFAKLIDDLNHNFELSTDDEFLHFRNYKSNLTLL